MEYMSKYIKYLKYLVRHKWYVTVECFKRGLYWRGLMHDISKFRPSEFVPYAVYFYGDKNANETYSGFYKPGDDTYFDGAWLKHIHRNPHHWQHWVLREDDGGKKILPMTKEYKLEMW